ncbi:MAG TPA: hypothetical protein VE344_02215 [Methylomirabilota bacterium]|nr:hypothetical protein [Methylomirabilota bacterium]
MQISNTVIVTGSAGLIGSESVKRFALEGFHALGIGNNIRQWLFSKKASTLANRQKLVCFHEKKLQSLA